MRHVPIDLDREVRLAHGVFLARVELFALVDPLATGVASHAERRHQTDLVLLVHRALAPRNLGRIKVGRVVLGEDIVRNHLLVGLGPQRAALPC